MKLIFLYVSNTISRFQFQCRLVGRSIRSENCSNLSIHSTCRITPAQWRPVLQCSQPEPFTACVLIKFIDCTRKLCAQYRVCLSRLYLCTLVHTDTQSRERRSILLYMFVYLLCSRYRGRLPAAPYVWRSRIVLIVVYCYVYWLCWRDSSPLLLQAMGGNLLASLS